MLVLAVTAALFLVAGGLVLYGAAAYRKTTAAREVFWTGAAALVLVALFAYVH